VHHNAPLYLAGVARPGPTQRENLVVHAMARLLLHGSIRNIQWQLGESSVSTACRQVLDGGVNDLGGTLMEEDDQSDGRVAARVPQVGLPSWRRSRRRLDGLRGSGRRSMASRCRALARIFLLESAETR